MIRSELITAVRTQLGDDGYDGDSIAEAGNWFVDEVCNNNHLRRMEDSDELSADIGDTTMDFPDTMKTMVSLYLTSPQVFDMTKRYVAYGDFMRSYANFASATASQASFWTDWGNAVRFSAPLNVAHTFQCDFLRNAVHVEDDSDEYDFPTSYDELLVAGATIRVMEIEEDYETASQKRDIMAPLMTTFIKNESRGQIKTGPNIMRTNRSRGRSVGVRESEF
jgi:hypothetical protein